MDIYVKDEDNVLIDRDMFEKVRTVMITKMSLETIAVYNEIYHIENHRDSVSSRLWYIKKFNQDHQVATEYSIDQYL